MRYEVRVAGKVFAGENVRQLLRRAVEAKRQAETRRDRPAPAPSWSPENFRGWESAARG
ncbi:MAG: hypothetical protein Kow00109_03580 [Acidobacteriota bacterium]